MSHIPVTSTPVTQGNSPVHLAHNHFTETSCTDTPLSTNGVADDNANLSTVQEGLSATPPGLRRSGRSPRKKSLDFENHWPLSSRVNGRKRSKSGFDCSLPLQSDELNHSNLSCMADISLLSQSADSCKVVLKFDSI
jgi:hypothetical protein